MSTTSPQPPQSGLSPFKDQTPFDPYLPSSPDEEQLTKVNANQNAAGPSENKRPPHPETGRAQTHVDTNLSSGYGGMSRAETYGLEGFEPQGFENSLLLGDSFGPLEDSFGPLPAPYDIHDMSLFRNSSFKRTDTGRTEEPQSASTSKGTDFSRRSTGLATHSSQLMSPVLTDAASPVDASFDRSALAAEPKLLGGGDMSRVTSSQSNTTAGQYTSYNSIAQQTPALTTSSYDVTPNLADEQQPFLPNTPTIQVGLHKRGDPPARAEYLDPGLQKRRRGSRTSSMLAVNTEGESEEMEADADEGDDNPSGRAGRDPTTRGDATRPSLNEQAQQRDRDDKNDEISQWLSVSATDGADPNQAAAPVGARQYLKPGQRRRAVSNSNPSDLPTEAMGFNQGLQAHAHARTLGPGILVNEDSGDEDDDATGSFVESAPPSVDGNEADARAEERDQFPPPEVASPEQESGPWVDAIYMPSHPDFRAQPGTSNAAMARFMKRAQDIETASRVATWGTMPRRMSDGDPNIERIFGSGGLLARLSISKERDRDEPNKEEWKGFRETVANAADRIRAKRANSATKRKGSEPSRLALEKIHSYDPSGPDTIHKRKDSAASSKHERKESLSSKASGHQSSSLLSRIPSGSKRPKSPRINTSGLAAAITTQIGALGAGSMSPTGPSTPMGWRERAKEKLGLHHRQSSDSPESTRVQSPPPAPPDHTPIQQPQQLAADEDAEADDDDQGVKMEIVPSKTNIIPTFDGFKAHVREKDPRLPGYLVERLGKEQLLRYKKLVAFKVEHAKHCELRTCPSGAACIAKGGQPKYFAAKSQPIPRTITGDDDDDDDDAVADGVVSEAQFPVGLPLPPAKRLPAEFECPLCFQVKKFQKPSDWSKHVHEDLQPFTCTFQHCPDPKSFKRKADWVRHENERHRQLEWWQCTEDGCSHLCYRRDNFVQHLVREHKLPEPKAKNPRPNKPAVRGPAKSKPKAKGVMSIQEVPLEDRVLYMVEVCKRETSKEPMHEPCRFCGNHCNTFKKLTVHLARHMESMSLPILELVKAKDVSPDTLISPVDIKLSQQGLSPVDAPNFSGAMGTTGYPTAMDLNVGPDVVGMAPLMGDGGFPQSHYPSSAAWSGQGSHMSAQGVPAYSNEMGAAWPASSGIYTQSGTAAYTNFPPSGGYLHHDAVSGNNDMYHMNSNQFHAPQYMDTDPHAGMAPSDGHGDGLGMHFDPSAPGVYSQAPAGGMYGAPSGQQPPTDQQRYYQY